MDPVTIGIGMAALGGTTSFMQAKAQRGYQEDVGKAQAKAVGVQMQQLSDQSALERLKSHNEANLIRSKLRVAAGESGIGFGGTYEAMMRQAGYDEMLNQEIINRNLMTGTAAARSQLQAREPTMNPLLSAFMGILGGAQSGMSLGRTMGPEGFGGGG